MRQSIDLESVKVNADLLSIIGGDTELKKVATSGGGEWAGPCPICGGRDRCRVQPQAHRWLCRHCTAGKWDSVIGYIALKYSLDPKNYKDLAEISQIAVGSLPTTNTRHKAPPEPAYQAPGADWQAAAAQVIDECESALWDPKNIKVLDYLRGRGLKDQTIKTFSLGYCATGERELYGREIAGLWVPRGIVIPCVVWGVIWYLKIRLMPDVPCRCQGCKADLPGPGKCPKCKHDNKYRGVKNVMQSRAIYNADWFGGSDIALFCEGEFDCMIAHQELNDVLPCVTFGSAGNLPDLATWGAQLLPLRVILTAYDADQPGQNGALALYDRVGDRVKMAPLPEGVKDINDYYLAGGDLWEWINPILNFHDSIYEMEVPMHEMTMIEKIPTSPAG